MYRRARSRPSQYPRSLKARHPLLPLTSFIRPSSWWQPGVHGLLYLTVFRGSQRATSFFREFLSGTSTFLEEISVYVACNHCFIRCKNAVFTVFRGSQRATSFFREFLSGTPTFPINARVYHLFSICWKAYKRRLRSVFSAFRVNF